MAKLILSMDGLVLKEIFLDKERLTIGRKPQNDVQIDNLAISGEHVAVVTFLNDSFLEDLNSTNGTLVNGQPIKKHFLRHNDVVELGKYKLRYVNEQLENTAILGTLDVRAVLSADKPGEADSEATQTGAAQLVYGEETARTASHEAEGAAPVPMAAIQILNGVNAGKQLELTKILTTLGKPGVQVAVIARRPHGYFITHVEGGNFPVVNGKLLGAQAHALADHDVIEICGIKMEFYFKV